MSELFLTILGMSIKASYAILFVILIRVFLKKAPKAISYALWGVVAFRLIFPFSIKSIFSLMPRSSGVLSSPGDILHQQDFLINIGTGASDSLAPAVGASADPLQIYAGIGAYIWVSGMIALIVYSLVSVFILKRHLKNARLTGNNIYEAPHLKTPFVLGLIRPRIYLPAGLGATERSYILLHEKTHIRRKDHIVKIAAFIVLSIHWFNPLVWVAFILMSTDMELSCDERVLKEVDEDIKKPYARSLLSLAAGKHILGGSPIAFGEGNVRGRIKNVMNYRKPAFWVIVVAVAAAILVGVGLFADPISNEPEDNGIISELMKNKTEYVGNNSKVGGIIYSLPYPDNIAYDSFELFTDSEPYGIAVNLKTDTDTMELFRDKENQLQFENNAVIMFSLIGNAEFIKFNLDDGSGPYSLQYTREWANQLFGKDVRSFAESREEFSKLINGIQTADKN